MNTNELKNSAIEGIPKYDAILKEIANIQFTQTDKSLEMCREVLEELQKDTDMTSLQKQKYTGRVYFAMGFGYKMKSDFTEALDYYNRCYKCFKEVNLPDMYSQILINLGVVHRYLGNFETSFKYLMEALDYYGPKNDLLKLSNIYTSLGNIYNDMDESDNALESYMKAKHIKEDLNDPESLSQLYNNIGTTYENMHKYDEALEYYFKAYNLKLKIGNEYSLAISLHNIGKSYAQKNNYSEALEHYIQSYKIMEKLNNSLGIAMNSSFMGKIYTKTGDYDQALEFLNKSMSIAQEKNIVKLIQNNHFFLADLYAAMHDYPNAYQHQRKYSELTEKLLSEENSAKFKQLKSRFENESKEKELEIYQLKNIELAKAYEDLQNAQSEIINLEKKNSAYAMAVTANHEINQPLMVLYGNLDMLFASIPPELLTEKIQNNINRVNISLHNISKILQKFRESRSISFERYTDEVQMVVFETE